MFLGIPDILREKGYDVSTEDLSVEIRNAKSHSVAQDIPLRVGFRVLVYQHHDNVGINYIRDDISSIESTFLSTVFTYEIFRDHGIVAVRELERVISELGLPQRDILCGKLIDFDMISINERIRALGINTIEIIPGNSLSYREYTLYYNTSNKTTLIERIFVSN